MIPIHPLPPEPPLRRPAPAPGQTYRFHTMVKPAGAQCNLDCSYCFYLHKEDLLQQPKMPRMRESLLEAHIRQYIEAQHTPHYEQRHGRCCRTRYPCPTKLGGFA